ncbi:hypothetical protein [Streptacidiphilus neutrinimicus]|uniref:hypothetical protein n=1 Tax=Streptacidiphilus neutrinimicus TaxID=105420 RepID=UPI000A7BE329|nr:hypothetical protein [Streptacidiphilus neutrinimicus]
MGEWQYPGPPGVNVMVCGGCGAVTEWTPWGRCSWECYEQPRETPDEQLAANEDAPRAFAYFTGRKALGGEQDGG